MVVMNKGVFTPDYDFYNDVVNYQRNSSDDELAAIISNFDEIIADEMEEPQKRAEACVEKFKYKKRQRILMSKLLYQALEWVPEMPQALVQIGDFYSFSLNDKKPSLTIPNSYGLTLMMNGGINVEPLVIRNT